jgi:hypothetical protein
MFCERPNNIGAFDRHLFFSERYKHNRQEHYQKQLSHPLVAKIPINPNLFAHRAIHFTMLYAKRKPENLAVPNFVIYVNVINIFCMELAKLLRMLSSRDKRSPLLTSALFPLMKRVL